MNENLKRHRPDIKVLGEGRAIAFMPEDPMGVWCHIQEVRDLLDVKDKVIAELKAKLQDQCISCPVKMQEDDVVAELKQKLEDAKATAYAESVDAGMRERRLKRALYKACANWALSTLAWLDCIDQGEPRKWSEMVRKCRNKAETYK